MNYYNVQFAGFIIIEYKKPNERNPAQVNCLLEGATWHSTADPIVELYRKYGNEGFNQVDFFSYGSVTGNEYVYLVQNVRYGEVFYCTMHDIDTYRSEEIIGDGSYRE